MTRTFTVFGKIKGKGLPITFWLKDKKGNPTRPITTKHPDTRSYESLIQEAYLAEHRKKPPFDCALSLSLDITMAVPKSYSKKKRAMCLSGELWPTKKPDNSNILKSIEDALSKGVAFIDDKLIVRHFIEKRYGEVEKMVVEISELEPVNRALEK